MTNNEQNFDEKATSSEPSQEKVIKKSKKLKNITKFFIYLSVFFVTVGIVFSSQVLMSEKGTGSWFSSLPMVKQIKQLAESANRELKGEKNDRINILLLGIGGKNHSGGLLTDTIMLNSIQPSTNKVSMISIPRDLVVPIENMGWKKINSINAYAEQDKKGSGGLATCQAIGDILNLPIDYYVRVDFQGFINVVDKIGGVTIDVENTFDDYSYPVLGNEDAANYASRYEHLHFDKGIQTMDGSLALKYARSRHGYGVEGSDFARAKRQQKIIAAVKEKVLSKDMLFKPMTIVDIINELSDHIDTNLKVWEILKFWDMAKEIDSSNMKSSVIDNGPNGLLINGRGESGAYILEPRSGDFKEIQYFANNIFNDMPTEITDTIIKDNAKVEVYNGTWINGLASEKAQDIEKYGFKVIKLGNSGKQNFQKSVIYDLTFGEKEESLKILKEKTGANVALGLPEWLVEDINQKTKEEQEQPDFILVIGQDADKTKSGTVNPVQ
ncbi:LCP family protein [Candidatus Parcubacteria bacterium]|nr:LCP family protein [Patescibacteria group bacterium]MBU4309892.1 LCP family protein [Patescibacteria group bacterium]MBU4431900.1 LCP family protein [Patescibacteria group bacterium]MBU4578231.1 LCP family protein [Patescibacteria group bacterium]MCG2696767.1 LCP family protein [Candidatus Parcubacteria bacterium]